LNEQKNEENLMTNNQMALIHGETNSNEVLGKGNSLIHIQVTWVNIISFMAFADTICKILNLNQGGENNVYHLF
jgi:hypothetical protein